jgi:Tol biopolymer transport system component
MTLDARARQAVQEIRHAVKSEGSAPGRFGDPALFHQHRARKARSERIAVGLVAAAIAIGSMALLSGLSHLRTERPATPVHPNGQIAFSRADPTACRDCDATYIANPDGSHKRKVYVGASHPRWSPDGSRLALIGRCSFDASCGAVIVDVDAGTTSEVPNLQPSLINQFFACPIWSPDGTRLACVAAGDTLGPGWVVYTIRTDGTDLTRVLSCPDDGCDLLDYSPDGNRLLIGRVDPSGDREIFSVELDGTGLRQITPTGTIVHVANRFAASWSPDGSRIVFGGQSDADHERSIFVVNADGTDLHQIPIPGCGTLRSETRSTVCFNPVWSPDGTKILLVRARANPSTIGKPSGSRSSAIYTVNPDGSGLTQVTTVTNLDLSTPDWGTHPATG